MVPVAIADGTGTQRDMFPFGSLLCDNFFSEDAEFQCHLIETFCLIKLQNNDFSFDYIVILIAYEILTHWLKVNRTFSQVDF